MKELVWHGPEEMSVEQGTEPTAEPGTVVLRTGAAGICGSEVEGYLGKMGNRTPPLVMGHEFAGTVVSVGEGVDEGWQECRAAVNPLVSCHACRLCRMGLTNICPERYMIGIHRPGGFAEFVRVPVETLSEIPDDLDMSAGALAEPLANGVHAVCLGAGHVRAEHIVVLGAGTIGLMCLQAATLRSIPNVSVVEPHEGRRRRASTLGAHEVFSSGEEAGEVIRDATEGLGADLVLDAVGAEGTRRLGVDLVRPGGCVVLVGLHADVTSVGFHGVVRCQVALQGSYAYTANDFEEALALISSGQAGIGTLPEVLPLERGPEVFADLTQGPLEQTKVFLAGSGA